MDEVLLTFAFGRLANLLRQVRHERLIAKQATDLFGKLRINWRKTLLDVPEQSLRTGLGGSEKDPSTVGESLPLILQDFSLPVVEERRHVFAR